MAQDQSPIERAAAEAIAHPYADGTDAVFEATADELAAQGHLPHRGPGSDPDEGEWNPGAEGYEGAAAPAVGQVPAEQWAAATRPRVMPGAALAIPDRAELDALLAPFELDMLTWGRSLFSGEEFPESDPDEAGIGILAAIMGAESSEEALNALDLKRAKKLCGDTPGGHSPLLEISGARVLRSEYAEGAPCYTIIKAVIVAEGDKIQFTTGSKAIQTVVFKHLLEGWMPFRAILTMRSHPTKRGFYPLGLEAGG